MNFVTSIIATNSVITLPDGTREVIADCALEDGARQINEGGGLPILVEHDWLRPCGWTIRAWTERDGLTLKLLTEGILPENESEWASILEMHDAYFQKQLKARTSHFEHDAQQIGVADVALTFDSDSVFLECEGLVTKVFPQVASEIDFDGLVPLDPNSIDSDGLIRIGEYFLVPSPYFRPSFAMPNAPNRELMSSLARLAKERKAEVRIRIDPNRLGIRRSFAPSQQRDYWWGPHYHGKPSQQVYGMSVHGPTQFDKLNKLLRTEFWWYGKHEPTLEIEELHSVQSGPLSARGKCGMRFVHSIFSEHDVPRHLDGAIRIYTESLWSQRTTTQLSEFGKQAERVKLWRADGDLATERWYELIHMFYRGNYTIAEYFGLPSPDQHRAEFERSLNAN